MTPKVRSWAGRLRVCAPPGQVNQGSESSGSDGGLSSDVMCGCPAGTGHVPQAVELQTVAQKLKPGGGQGKHPPVQWLRSAQPQLFRASRASELPPDHRHGAVSTQTWWPWIVAVALSSGPPCVELPIRRGRGPCSLDMHPCPSAC